MSEGKLFSSVGASGVMRNGGGEGLLEPIAVTTGIDLRGALTHYPGGRRLSNPLGYLLSVLLGFILPLTVFAGTPDAVGEESWILTLGVSVVGGLVLARLIVIGESRLYLFSFWLYVYIFLGLAPTTFLRTGNFPSTTPDVLRSDLLPAALLVLLGIATFAVGYRKYAPRNPVVKNQSSVRARISLNRSLALFMIAAVVTIEFIRRIGLTAILTTRDLRSATLAAAFPDPTTAALFSAGAWVPLQVSTVCILYVGRAEGRLSPSLRLLVASGFLLTLLVNNPISGARYHVGAMLFGYLVMLGAASSKKRARVLFGATIAGFLLVFPIADRFRQEISTTSFAQAGLVSEYDGNGDYDSYTQIANTVTLVRLSGVTTGKQALGVVAFFLPRSLWPGKPRDTGVLVAEMKGYKFTNISSPLWAEFYVNFGWPGVLVGFALVGCVFAKLDNFLVYGKQVLSPWYVASAGLSLYTIIILRGSLLQAMALPSMFVSSVVVVTKLSSVSKYESSQRKPDYSVA